MSENGLKSRYYSSCFIDECVLDGLVKFTNNIEISSVRALAGSCRFNVVTCSHTGPLILCGDVLTKHQKSIHL